MKVDNIIRRELINKNIIFVYLFVIAYTIYFLNLPPWWDGTTTAITSIETIRTMNPYIDFFAKPPFIFISLGGLIKIFGYSPAIIHIFMLVFSLIALIYTYKVGKFLCKNENIALAASGLLAVSPLFISQSINLNFDLPSMALIMASYYYLLKKNYNIYAIVSSILVMTKEVGILFVVAVILSTGIGYIFNNKKFYKDIKKVFVIQIVPIILFILWAYGNYMIHGWFIFPRNSPILKLESILDDNFFIHTKQLFIINFNWILIIFISIFGIMQLYKYARPNIGFKYNKIELCLDSSLILLPMILFTILYFVVTAPIKDFNLPRYVMVLYPQFYLISSYTISGSVKNEKRIFHIVIMTIIVLFVAQTAYNKPFIFLDPITQSVYPEKTGTTLGGSDIMEVNLNYVNYIEADIELVKFLNGVDTSIPVILNRFNHYNIFVAANKGIDLGYGLRFGILRSNIDLDSFYKNPDKIKLPAIVVLENFNTYDVQRLSDIYNVTFMKNISVKGAGEKIYSIGLKKL